MRAVRAETQVRQLGPSEGSLQRLGGHHLEPLAGQLFDRRSVALHQFGDEFLKFAHRKDLTYAVSKSSPNRAVSSALASSCWRRAPSRRRPIASNASVRPLSVFSSQ